MTEYKLVKQKVILGKKRNIYKKKGSNKEYVKYKCKMMNVVKYKKMKTKKLPKKRKLSRKTKKRGGDYVTTKFESYTPHQKAHMLLRGIRDSQNRIYTWQHQVDTNNEALIPLNQYHVNLIKNNKSNDVSDTERESMARMVRSGKLIKINLTHMPNSEKEVQLEKTNKKFFRDRNIRSNTVPVSPKQEKRFSYVSHIQQGTPALRNPNGPPPLYIDDNNTCKGQISKDRKLKVPYCKVYDESIKNYRYFPDQECDNVPNKCVLDDGATKAFNSFVENPKIGSVSISGLTAREAAHAAATKYAASKGGKRRKVKKSVKTKKFK